MKQFNVLHYDFNFGVKPFDVLPRFRNAWDCDKFNFGRDKVNTLEDLKTWVLRVSLYYFWSKCEHEFIMLPWPYSDNHEKMEKEMCKIDVHYQIKMNIDTIVGILWEEFKLYKI